MINYCDEHNITIVYNHNEDELTFLTADLTEITVSRKNEVKIRINGKAHKIYVGPVVVNLIRLAFRHLGVEDETLE